MAGSIDGIDRLRQPLVWSQGAKMASSGGGAATLNGAPVVVVGAAAGGDKAGDPLLAAAPDEAHETGFEGKGKNVCSNRSPLFWCRWWLGVDTTCVLCGASAASVPSGHACHHQHLHVNKSCTRCGA